MSFLGNLKENVNATLNHYIREKTNPAKMAEYRLDNAKMSYNNAVNKAATATAERKAAERNVARIEQRIEDLEKMIKGQLKAGDSQSRTVQRMAKEKLMLESQLVEAKNTLSVLEEAEDKLLDMVSELAVAKQQLQSTAMRTIAKDYQTSIQKSINAMQTEAGMTTISSLDMEELAQKRLDAEMARTAIINENATEDISDADIKRELERLAG